MRRFYDLVVKDDPNAHIVWRRKMLRECEGSASLRDSVREMCKADFLFFCNTMLWTFDPRLPGEKYVPFCTFGYQDRIADALVRIIGKRCGVFEKFRDAGMTWLVLMVMLWRMLFFRGESFLVASINADMVDGSREGGGDMDALMPRFDLALKFLPEWLRGEYSRTKMKLAFPATGSRCDGRATTQDLSRGGRRTAVFPDEFTRMRNAREIVSSVAFVSDCVLYNGTPTDKSHEMYRMIRNKQYEVIRCEWTEDPRKAAGLYKVVDGKVEALDKGYQYDPHFKYVLDPAITAKFPVRSPWFDVKCAELNWNDRLIAREILCDWGDAGTGFFPSDLIERLLNHVQDPVRVGQLEYDGITLAPVRFSDHGSGKLMLWFDPDRYGGNPPPARYALGVDVSAGRGASCSVISVVDRDRGLKVAEYADARIFPYELAHMAIAMGKWFNGRGAGKGGDALLCWEGNGPGQVFAGIVEQHGYWNVFHRPLDVRKPSAGVGKDTGWWTTIESKRVLFEDYHRKLENGDFTNPSRWAVMELDCYKWCGRSIEHEGSIDTDDPSDAKDNHGDRVIADALSAWNVLSPDGKTDEPLGPSWYDPPAGSWAARMDDDLRRELMEHFIS